MLLTEIVFLGKAVPGRGRADVGPSPDTNATTTCCRLREGPRRTRAVHRAGGRKCGTAGQRENTHHWITVLSAQGQALWEGLRDLSRDRDSSQGLPAAGRHRGRDRGTPGTSWLSSNILPVKPVLPPWQARPEQVSGTFHVLPSLLVNPFAVSQEEM